MSEPSPPLVLHGEPSWISPYVYSCFVALREKGLDFEVRDVSLGQGEQERPAYRDRSLTGRVPALAHGDFWLAESSAIIEYLDEAFAAPAYPRLLPAGLRERARARQVMAWVRSDLDALRAERPTTTMFFERASTPLSEAGRRAADKLLRVSESLVGDGREHLDGDWSIADTDLSFMLHRLILNEHDVPASLRAYAERQWRRPSARAYLEHARRPPV
ncbi:MAG: glutathione transferase [Polyangiaceae bacterium]|jgi:glutathione S-transferase|nr:glutathione transferase [Polyangiaceae bacterium]